MYRTAYLTDKGLKRKINEDALLVADACGLFVVADGMGGYERGEIASRIVVENFKEMLCFEEDSTLTYADMDNEETIPYFEDEDEEETIAYGDEMNSKAHLCDKLNQVVEVSTRKIMTYTREKRLSGQIGTTLAGLYKLRDEEEMALFHLGDSRVYRIRKHKIECLTTDHSKYEQMKQSGKYTEKELLKVNRNSITKAIGNFKVIPLEMSYIQLQKDDIYILCSDGVSDLVDDFELLKLVESEQSDLNKVVVQLKNIVYERGAKDNLSIIIFIYEQ
jgi:protein phosphatase